jgi:DNA-binding NarL/FixJ family response regulator
MLLIRTLVATQPNKKTSSQVKVLGPGVRILMADDFSAWRVAARKIVEMCPTWKVIAEAGDGLEAVEKATKLQPDVVLLDVGMPVLNGIEAATRIKQTSPASKIIFLTQDVDVELRVAALSTGAEAYVLKAGAVCDLRPAVKAALRNGSQPHALDSRPFAHISL